LSEQFREQEAMVRFEDTYQCLFQLNPLRTQATTCKIGQHLRITLASEHGFEHSTCRLTQDIRGDITQLDISVF
jgi:hypothetical protein